MEVNKSWTAQFIGDYVELKWRDYTSYIDKSDLHFFKENVLRIIKGSNSYPYVYIVTSINGKFKYKSLHRVLVNAKEHEFVDHKNNSLDNRRENLRICTISQNQMNAAKKSRKTSSNCTSKYKGVHLNHRGKWVCLVGTSKARERYSFTNEIAAAEKYNERALVLFGEFAKLNVIER